MHITVIVATLGRRRECEDLVNDLAGQTRLPDQTLFVVTTPEDAPPTNRILKNRTVVSPKKGLCAQRNLGLEETLGSSDIIVFFDDDFVPHATFLERMERAFVENPHAAGLTGFVAADGVCGPGLTREEALDAIETEARRNPDGDPTSTEVQGLYGCNMAMRASAIGERRFDERLPLYGWLEDLDLTNQLLAEGKLVKLNRLVGAHRGVKAGRVSGIRLGYSQIVNSKYLIAKGTAPKLMMLRYMLKFPLVNAAKSLKPESYIDRKGRLHGNLIAIRDLATGRSKPERILEL
ncbi:hypothetical protein BPTFM16_01563 [Altererythrobacter insulae]|nr:hypothetical protein BPTFM16_01563 [Altererythrobacter insulae]